MREITKTVLGFLVGFILVMVLSAFLAPWLATFLPFKFDRILRRCIMIGTLLLVARLIWARRKETWGRFGLAWNTERGRLLIAGFLAGVVLIGGMSLLQWALGVRFFQLYESDLWHWIGLVFKGLGAGVLIGILEELFFRGFLFVTVKDFWSTPVSLVVTNVIYAQTHFFPKEKVFIAGEPTFYDSFRIYAKMFPPPWETPERFLALLGLFFFGLILSFVFLRAGSLFPAMGIHAGAVFSLKLSRRFIPEMSDKMGILSGTKNLYDGIAGLAVLVALSLVAGWRFRFSEEKYASR